MDSRQAKVVAGSQTRDDQFLFGLGWRWFLQHRFDFVEIAAVGYSFGTDSAKKGQQVFTSRLDRRDGARFPVCHID